jgi:hypothetical protein
MVEYTVYYKGDYYTFRANSVELLWGVVRQQKGAQFSREATLCKSELTTEAVVIKSVLQEVVLS